MCTECPFPTAKSEGVARADNYGNRARSRRAGSAGMAAAGALDGLLCTGGRDVSISADRPTMLVAAAIAAALTVACEKPAAVAVPAPEVYVASVVQKDVPVYMELV